MHLYTILEVDNDPRIVGYSISTYADIHDVVEREIWPPPFLPDTNDLVVPLESDRRLNHKAN